MDNDLLAIVRKIPGVQVLKTNAAPAVTIRGLIPVYIVDGIEIEIGFRFVADYVRHRNIKSVKLIKFFEPKGIYTRQDNRELR